MSSRDGSVADRSASSTDPSTNRSTGRSVADRAFIGAALLFAIGEALHTADHLRRGPDSVTTELFWTGTAGVVVAAVVIVLVLARHRLAPLAALVIGPALALGFTAAHLLPSWSVLSDPFLDGRVGAVSWVAFLTELAGALVVGAVGGYLVLRDRRDRRDQRGDRTAPAPA